MATGEDPAVTRFREYLRLPSVHPNPDYTGCIAWLKNQAEEIGLLYNIVNFPPPAEFAIYMKWEGTDPSLSSILLNSHIDVVPVDPTRWTHDPFGAEKDENGNIYARGSQDMKCVGVQYLEAIRRMKSKGITPLRNVYVSFVPDEEVGDKGMESFLKTPEFKKLNVGFAMDEGIASTNETFEFFYGERSNWEIRVTATGKAGHGSRMIDDTAAEKLESFIGKMLVLREEQKKFLQNGNLDLGDVTTINLTILKGGQASNVIPSELSATFDIRIPPRTKLSYWEDKINQICEQIGPGIGYTTEYFNDATIMTDLSSDNLWWPAFKEACLELKITINPKIFQAVTDARLLRNLGIPTFGFSPMNNTPILLHDNDEFLNEKIFLRGIEIYEVILGKVIQLTDKPKP